jgi:hypothetical protein
MEVWKMKRLTWLVALLAVVGLTLGIASATNAKPKYTPPSLYTLYTLKATGFTSNGDLVSGWYWLRSSADTAEWTFDVTALQGIPGGRVYLNLSGLATKGVNGASGYNGALQLRYVGIKTVSSSIGLWNPFRPRELRSLPMKPTNGVGYAVYGAVSVSTSAFKGATTMKIIASRSNSYAVRDIHVALSKDAALIAYVK